jgi:hypothetical protein
LLFLPNDVSVPGDVIGEMEAPARRPLGGRRLSDLGEAEARIELADHVILGGGDVIGDQRPRAAFPRRIDGDIHRFEFELAAEYAATHHPILDLEHFVVSPRRAQDHRADESVVAHAVQKAKLQGHGLGIFHDTRDLVAGVSTRRGVELIGLVDELDDASVIDGGERTRRPSS